MRKPCTSRVTDAHSALNATQVARVIEPHTIEDVVRAVRHARNNGLPLAIAGGRHATGGQQFFTGATLLDMRSLKKVRQFDSEHGLLDVEAGITWPDVIRGYLKPGSLEEFDKNKLVRIASPLAGQLPPKFMADVSQLRHSLKTSNRSTL